MSTGVYLIHFTAKLHHAQHYIGYADNIERRLEENYSGCGARLPQVIAQLNITQICVRMWLGKDRHFERRLKNRKKARMLCPICNPKSSHRNAPRSGEIDPDVDF